MAAPKRKAPAPETGAIAAPAPIIAAEAIPLGDLYLSDLNPRQEADPEGIALLADSIAMIGLIQPIAGLRDDLGRVGIVAGGRRLRAIKLAIERDPELIHRRPEVVFVPVRLAPDRATAAQWAVVENAAREDLSPADEIRAFGRMRDGGATVANIARAFATTEARVYRRLALADLPVPVLEALATGEISLGAATVFTIAQDETLALSVLARVKGQDYSDHQLRHMLQPDAVSATDRRALYVGTEAYDAAGGKRTDDLFAETTYMQDAALLDRLFVEKLDARAAELGRLWSWVEVSTESYLPYGITEKLRRLYPEEEPALTEEQAERYDELAELAEAEAIDAEGEAELEGLQAILDGAGSSFTEAQQAHGGVFLIVGRDGQERHEGPFVRPQEAKAATAAGVLTGFAAERGEDEGADSPPKPAYSAALVEDLHRARLHAVQSALADNFELVLDLLGFVLSGSDGRYDTALDLRPTPANITPEKPEGLRPDPRFAADPEDDARQGWLDDEARVSAFEAFRAQGQEARNAAIATGLARTLIYGSKRGLFDHVEKLAGGDLRQRWTPTAEGFFGRVNGDYLDALLLDLTGCDPNGSGFKTYKGQKKAEKALSLENLFTKPEHQSAWKLDDAKRDRLDRWRPGCV